LTKKELKYLVDVQLFIEELDGFFPAEKKFETFNNNIQIKRAVERMFELIGEAIRNYKSLNKEIEISSAKEIVGLRNLIAHAYDSIDYPKLWAIFINSIPQLKTEIDNLVERYDLHFGSGTARN
jgi:uncharacterized protein with HEPN domain